MDFNEKTELELHIKGVETALEWSKQLTTLATGTLVLSGTFIKEIFSGKIEWEVVIMVCWTSMLLSTLFGIIYVGALCSMLTGAKKLENLDLYKHGNVVALLHVITFLIGLGSFMAFIAKNLF